MYSLKKLLTFSRITYRFDLRSLALMRIAVAIVILIDLSIRFKDLTAHYTDEGIWPVRLALSLAWKPWSWSIHGISGSYSFTFILFLIHFIFAFFLLIGFKGKLSTIVLWLLTISLQNRNLFVLQAGDDLLRLLLFWAIFLPWHCRYSWDSRKNKVNSKQNTFVNLGYLILLASVYFFTVCLKTSSEWHSEGTAIYYALGLEQMRLPLFGDWLYQWPQLMKQLTWLVYGMELSLPLLILFPKKNGNLRLAAFILIFVLHIGIGLTLYVGLFFIINIASAMALLPSFVLDKFEKKARIDSYKNVTLVAENSYVTLLKNSFFIIVIFLCLLVNLGNMNWFNYQLKPQVWYPINALRLDQYWGMFSPTVMKKDGWYVYHGMDSIGRQWDLRLNQDYVDYKKPEHVVSI